ncbi:metallophosphoesterase family protein [Rhizobium halophytocola]|uniref:Phosphodiesterase n=1 Tax=Rhizobium halophytocola TaxID=735519 RepID=A0ABS4DSC2_9HYPH|nr:metallophosphoesterase family protein [Rhizobium halophytocola]MBP1848598.1 putative phosphodiesterase [Rhizobium halophytocola]
MRFAAIADIHGNHLALQAVLADIEGLGIRHIVNLGDVFSGPVDAGKTADILRPLDLPTVRGNHDRALLEDATGDWERPAHPLLSKTDIDWLHQLPLTLSMFREEVLLCHATPSDDVTGWLETLSPNGHFHMASREFIEQQAVGVDYPLILCGHTHIQRAVLLSGSRLVVNPGSVGCPGFAYHKPVDHLMQQGTPFACYAIVEKTPRGFQPTFRQVPYDNLAAAKIARSRGFEDWAAVLSTGWVG